MPRILCTYPTLVPDRLFRNLVSNMAIGSLPWVNPDIMGHLDFTPIGTLAPTWVLRAWVYISVDLWSYVFSVNIRRPPVSQMPIRGDIDFVHPTLLPILNPSS